jgi:recombination protein RecA
MASALDGLRKSINKKYEKEGYTSNIAQVGVPLKKFGHTFSLGSPSLDFMTYNSIPEGIFIEISGKEASGKTTMAFKIAADFIKREKEKPVEERRHIMFVDAEGTADPLWAKTSSGYDMNDPDIETLYFTPLGQSAEQIFDDIIEAVKTGQIGLVIMDSLVAIAGQQTADESMTKKDMGGIAKILADFTRRATGLFNRYKTTFIGINGIIMNIGGYGNPETTPGGEYWRRACSLRLRTKRGEYFDADGNVLKSTAESPAGHVIEVALLKTKFCRWDRKLGRCHLNYTKGIDILLDTIELATYFGIIVSPASGSFQLTDPATGELICDETGTPIKIRGQKNIKPYFEENLNLWRKVYDKVYELLSKKEDTNIMSYERMLGLDVDSLFGINLALESE